MNKKLKGGRFDKYDDKKIIMAICKASQEFLLDHGIIKPINIIYDILSQIFFPSSETIRNNLEGMNRFVIDNEIIPVLMSVERLARPRYNEIRHMIADELNDRGSVGHVEGEGEGGFMGGYKGGAFPRMSPQETQRIYELTYDLNHRFPNERYPQNFLEAFVIPDSVTIINNLMRMMRRPNYTSGAKRNLLNKLIHFANRIFVEFNEFGNRMEELSQIGSMSRIRNEATSREPNHGISDVGDGYRGKGFGEVKDLGKKSLNNLIFQFVRTPLHRMIPIVLGKLYYPDSQTIYRNIRNIDKNAPVWNHYIEILNSVPDVLNRTSEILKYINEYRAEP